MDLLAVFRARVTAWCVNAANKSEETGDANKESLALLKPPFRLISHGHELTPDLDSKSLGELGIRDQQVSTFILSILFLFFGLPSFQVCGETSGSSEVLN